MGSTSSFRMWITGSRGELRSEKFSRCRRRRGYAAVCDFGRKREKTAVPLESPENARARVCAFISAAKTWKGVSSLSRDPLARSRSHFVHILLVFSLSFFFSLFFSCRMLSLSIPEMMSEVPFGRDTRDPLFNRTAPLLIRKLDRKHPSEALSGPNSAFLDFEIHSEISLSRISFACLPRRAAFRLRPTKASPPSRRPNRVPARHARGRPAANVCHALLPSPRLRHIIPRAAASPARFWGRRFVCEYEYGNK